MPESGAPEPTAYERGAEMIADVYAGAVTPLPEGAMAFNDVMLRTLFAELWPRDVLSMRDKRLLLMGSIAASGQADIWKLQAQSALRRGELNPDELRETLVMLAPYAGYPNVAPMVGMCEQVIGEWKAWVAEQDEAPAAEE